MSKLGLGITVFLAAFCIFMVVPLWVIFAAIAVCVVALVVLLVRW